MTGYIFQKIGISLLGPLVSVRLFFSRYYECGFMYASVLHKRKLKCNKNRYRNFRENRSILGSTHFNGRLFLKLEYLYSQGT
jgi:hypothetical protein